MGIAEAFKTMRTSLVHTINKQQIALTASVMK